MTLSIITFTCRGINSTNKLTSILKLLSKTNFLCLQETTVRNITNHKALFEYYQLSWSFSPAGEHNEGGLLTLSKTESFTLIETESCNIFQSIKCREVHILNFHLPHIKHSTSARQLFTHTEKLDPSQPTIICGDANAFVALPND